MQQKEEKYQRLIVKSLSKEISDSEQAELQNWLSQHPENVALFDEYRDDLSKVASAGSAFEPDMNLAWAKIKTRINKDSKEARKAGKTKVISLFSSPCLRIAASIMVVSLISLMAYFQLSKKEMITLSAGLHKKMFLLPDSSKVWLSANSTLSFEEGLEGNEREVKLSGEGFFEVRRDVTKPFIVQGCKTKVQVLGTSFVVHSYPNENEEFVLVASGKVSFEEAGKPDNSAILTAGDKAIYIPGKQMKRLAKSGECERVEG